MNDLALTRNDWAAQISAAWRSSVSGIIETGRLIAAAKAALPHGDFTIMVGEALPFTARTAQRLMAIGADERLSNPTRVSLLPPNWGTLYELTKLDDERLEAEIAAGTIRPDMERREIAQAVKRDRRDARETELAAKQTDLPDKRFGVILADPEWRFEPYSRDSGMDRAADNHYPTSSTSVIASRPVATIAAEDCCLFLWATVPMLPDALEVMAAWGFKYVSQCIWVKDRQGTGYWFRNRHEILLVGTRGNVPAPAPGTQFGTIFSGLTEQHSKKPDVAYEIAEAYFPNLPKIELNARARRPGWDAWGLEAGEDIDPETGEIFVAADFDPVPIVTVGASHEAIFESAHGAGEAEAVGTGKDNAAPVPAASNVIPNPREIPFGDDDDGLDIPNFLKRGHPDCIVKTEGK